MDTQQIKERLRNSLEIAVIKKTLLSLIPIALLVLIVSSSPRSSASRADALVFSVIICSIAILPFLIFYTVRIVSIFRKPECYIFCRAKLSQPHAGSFRDSIYFTVLLEDPDDGSSIIADTHEIFSTRSITNPELEDYINKTVTIAYNRETEMVVVIG